MFTDLKLAWRNLWRNKRRTSITIASIFFGVLISTVMSSMQEGSYSSMIDNIVKFYSGYIQVQNPEYWENKTINNTFSPSPQLIQTVNQQSDITSSTMRLESFALASSESITKGALIIGVQPESEDQVTELKKWIKEGSYLAEGDNGVLVGSDLAKYLQLSIEDTIVLLGQGYHGVSAAGKYPIRGILHFSSPDLNKQTIYMDLGNAQDLYTADGLATSQILMVEDQYHLDKAVKRLRKNLDEEYVALTWNELHPEILQMIEADRAGAVFMKAILYILIAFGIFGTIMMMISERQREMGVMVAIGMQKSKMAKVLIYETILIGMIGVIAGFAGSIPIINYFFNNPIVLTGDTAETMKEMGFEPLMYFSWSPRVFYNQVITVFFITLIIGIYPLISAFKLKVHQALRA